MSVPEPPVRVNVLVNDEHLARIDAVKAALEDAGLSVDQVLGLTGIITGTAPDPSRLEGIRGVDAVERSREIQLPPPDAPVQ